MIDGCTVGYEFDIEEFLDREIRDHAVGGKKPLLAYPCIIKQICLVVGV